MRLFEESSSESVLERKVGLETSAKQALAIEKLILSLTLTMCVPGTDVRDLGETFEQIEDLIECFKQLKLGSDEDKYSKKKAKKENSEKDSNRAKAFSVLFDLLIA